MLLYSSVQYKACNVSIIEVEGVDALLYQLTSDILCHSSVQYIARKVGIIEDEGVVTTSYDMAEMDAIDQYDMLQVGAFFKTGFGFAAVAEISFPLMWRRCNANA